MTLDLLVISGVFACVMKGVLRIPGRVPVKVAVKMAKKDAGNIEKVCETCAVYPWQDEQEYWEWRNRHLMMSSCLPDLVGMLNPITAAQKEWR